MDTMLAAGAAGAFSNRPSGVFGVERDAKTPTSFNYSVGVQREIGWGTVLDVTYAGFQMRNGEMSTNINDVPDGARFLDVHPENRNPQNPTTAKPAEFLRPYSGYQDITIRSHFGNAHYNSLQVQLNRRYIKGLQFAVAYTLAKTVSLGPNGDPPTYIPNRPGTRGTSRRRVDAAAQPGRQLHLGRAERQPDVEQRAHARRCSTAGSCRATRRSSAATGRARARRRRTTSTSPAATPARVRGSAGDVVCSAAATAIRRRAIRAATSTWRRSAG